MNDNRACLNRDTAYIDTNRIFDSCRDKDCFENTAVFLTDYGRDIVEHSTNVRVCSAEIAGADISVDPVQFNNGFYRIDIRVYIKMTFECCVNMTNRQIIEGLCVCDKHTVLYGGEGCTSVFRSDPDSDGFCPGYPDIPETTSKCACNTGSLPTAVLEVADPVVLGAKIIERKCPHHCPCQSERDIPQNVASRIGNLAPQGERRLVVSLGLFTVVRLERPAQYLIDSARLYTVPEKECDFTEPDDACSMFKNMEFPVSEFNNESCDNCGKR